MKIIIPVTIPSANQLLRMHYQARKRLMWEFMWEIRAAGIESRGNAGREKRTVRITSYRGRMLDKDNLYGGAKVCLDAIKKMNLIRDDSPKWIELEVIQVSERLNPRTEIEISKETST